MTEREYFSYLEFRISGEMAGMRDRSLRGYWCDGLVPEQFAVSGDKCRISGRAYFGKSGQEHWTFVVLLGSETTIREKVNWKSLLPPSNMTGWLALDFDRKLIKVNPFSARPDIEAISKLAGVTEGKGMWGNGDTCVDYHWTLTDTSQMLERHERIGALGPGLFVLVKAKRTAETDPELRFQWIQYTVALHEGQVYVPPSPAPPWPWDGVDTGARNDGSPYTETPARQARLDAGTGIGWHAVVQDLYEVGDADSIFIDWPASGGNANWGHFSVVGLIGSKRGKDRLIGAMKFAYSTDARNKLVSYGGAPAEAAEIEAWKNALRAGFVDYMKNVFVDENP